MKKSLLILPFVCVLATPVAFAETAEAKADKAEVAASCCAMPEATLVKAEAPKAMCCPGMSGDAVPAVVQAGKKAPAMCAVTTVVKADKAGAACCAGQSEAALLAMAEAQKRCASCETCAKDASKCAECETCHKATVAQSPKPEASTADQG